MFRFLMFAVFAAALTSSCLAENPSAQLTLLNTRDHDVVVGVYTPLNGGIEELLIPLPSHTAVEEFPIPNVANEQFTVAYKARAIGGKLLRTKPIEIIGTGRICIVNGQNKPYAIIQYRGDERRPVGSWSRELVSPENDGAANRLRKEVAHAKLIKTTTKYSHDAK